MTCSRTVATQAGCVATDNHRFGPISPVITNELTRAISEYTLLKHFSRDASVRILS